MAAKDKTNEELAKLNDAGCNDPECISCETAVRLRQIDPLQTRIASLESALVKARIDGAREFAEFLPNEPLIIRSGDPYVGRVMTTMEAFEVWLASCKGTRGEEG